MKYINLFLLPLFIFLFSACTVKDKFETKILDKIDNPVVTLSPSITDDQLLKDLESDPDFKIDSTFNSLNSELQ